MKLPSSQVCPLPFPLYICLVILVTVLHIIYHLSYSGLLYRNISEQSLSYITAASVKKGVTIHGEIWTFQYSLERLRIFHILIIYVHWCSVITKMNVSVYF